MAKITKLRSNQSKLLTNLRSVKYDSQLPWSLADIFTEVFSQLNRIEDETKKLRAEVQELINRPDSPDVDWSDLH